MSLHASAGFLVQRQSIMRTLVFLIITSLMMMSSCGDSSLTRTLPNVKGTTGEVLVVMDKPLWDGSPGAAVRAQVSPYLIGLPQPEPAFTILPVNPAGFRDVYVAHRNIIIVKIVRERSEAQIDYSRDRWAETQLVITVAGPDTASVADCIRKEGAAIRQSINDAERERLTAWLTYSAGKGRSLLRLGESRWEMLLPAGYKPDFNREAIMMISAETPSTTQSVIVSVAERMTSRIGCIELANLTEKVTSAEVKGPDGGSFMVIEKQIPVSCRTFRRNETDYIEMRGLWTLQGGYMGGPFISYAFIDEETSRAIVVTGFVYAPRDEKRELLRQVEALMYTLKKAS